MTQTNSSKNTLDKEIKLKAKQILERATEEVRQLHRRSPHEIWQEFDIIWDKIASQNQK